MRIRTKSPKLTLYRKVIYLRRIDEWPRLIELGVLRVNGRRYCFPLVGTLRRMPVRIPLGIIYENLRNKKKVLYL